MSVEIAEPDRVSDCRRAVRSCNRKEVREDGVAIDPEVVDAKRIRDAQLIRRQERNSNISEPAWAIGAAGDVVLTEIECVWGRGKRTRRPPGNSRIPVRTS